MIQEVIDILTPIYEGWMAVIPNKNTSHFGAIERQPSAISYPSV
jgi:hypothetical protein